MYILKYKQALRNSCELLRQRKELYASSFNFMKVHVTACKLMKIHVSLWNFMKAHESACKLK